MTAIHQLAHCLRLNASMLTHVRGIDGHLFITTKCATCGELDDVSDMTHSTACECEFMPEGAAVPNHLRAPDPRIRSLE